jgi:CBS domain-containing protein
MNVGYLMSAEPVTCRPSDPLKMAAGLMWDYDCGALPGVDDDHRLVGIITDRDVCMASYSQGEPLHSVPVERSMSREAVSCYAEDTPLAVERKMRAHKVRRLPVVDPDGRVVGIVSINDLVRESSSIGAEPSQPGMSPAEIVETLSAIGESRRSDDESAAS